MLSLTSRVHRGTRLLGLLLSVLVGSLTAPQAKAQAPFLDIGIYGGVPKPDIQRGLVVSARLTRLFPPYLKVKPVQITVALNGLLNYSFYYQPTLKLGVNTFLPAGLYRVEYLDVFGNTTFAGTVFYKPNADFTNGIQVPDNPPNSGPWALAVGPLGVHGTVSMTFGPSNQPHPVKGATVELLSAETGKLVESLPTNGKGFYSFYYTFGVNAGFLPPGKYLVRVTLAGASQEQTVAYQPVTDPTSMGYYVLGASAVVDFTFEAP